MIKLNLIIEYFKSCNSFIQFILILEFVEFTVVLTSFLCFSLWYYYSHSIELLKCKSYFLKLPTFNKIFVIWFSVFYAIPNKIFVNNNISKFSIMFFIFLLIVISNLFSLFILLYIIFWIIVLESYFFALFYENKVSFKHFINHKLFKDNDTFAKEYFSFFWGNMHSGGAGKIKAGVVGTVLGGLFQVARNQEKTNVRVQGQVETQIHYNNAVQKPQTVEESLAIQKKVEAYIVERDTIILKTEKTSSRFWKKSFGLV